MIPLRVYLKNFLCHAEQEFRFDDHPVWLLHGPNGVGKSAVFDGMVYALYGESRRSDDRKNIVSDVIRHGESSMRVEFDFEVAGQRYRVWRTRARSGTKQGVNRSINGQWSPIRDVNAVDDLIKWVEQTVGLNYDAFVSAVLLRQGAAEKLIDADKDMRRELFRSFIDLDPYIDLHNRVTGVRAELSTQAKTLRIRFEKIQNITDDQLAQATVAEQSADQQLQKVRREENASRNRLGHARTWEQLENSRRRIQEQLDAAAGRMRNAADINKTISRLKALRELVPSLNLVEQLQRALAGAAELHQNQLNEQLEATTRHSEVGRALDQVRKTISTLRDQINENDQQIVVGEAEQDRLSEEIGRAEMAEDLHSKLSDLRAKKFDANLDDQLNDAEQTAKQAQSDKDALPHLDALFAQRETYRKATADEKNSAQRFEHAVAEVERLRSVVDRASEDFQTATGLKNKAERAVAVANEQHEQAVKKRDHFADAATKPICSECLQPIDASHASKERGKLETAVKEAEDKLNKCNAEAISAAALAESTQNQHQLFAAEFRAAEQTLDDEKHRRADFHQRATDAKLAFDRALNALGEPLSQRVAAITDDGFPTANEIAELRRTARDLAARIRRRDNLRTQVADREQTLRDIQTLAQSVAAVGAPADVTVARATHTELCKELDECRSKRGQDDASRLAAETSESEIASELQSCAQRLTQLVADVARGGAEVKSARNQLDTAVSSVPAMHRESALAKSKEEIQALALELERIEESQIEKQFIALADDRALQADRERQLGEIDRQINDLPADARRHATEVENEVLAAEVNTRAAEKVLDIARTKARTLAEQQQMHRETEQQLHTIETKHALHERLATLLGQDGIQLDLVRAEEGRIIARANDILMRLSLGELRLEPPDPESKRAFDLSVRRSGCPQPIAVGNLSGGQRFRTAVSLALAVSQGTSNAARRLESVIIDEGFGSLDREGRLAMVSELRDGQSLAKMFKRIIVVSHQEDFAAAFPVGYRFWTENASTRTEPFGLRG
jgi:DNA repair protein SbcC/Rad50